MAWAQPDQRSQQPIVFLLGTFFLIPFFLSHSPPTVNKLTNPDTLHPHPHLQTTINTTNSHIKLMSIETRRRSQVGFKMKEKDNKEIAAYDDHHDFHPDPAVIARLRRKIDWHLLPLLSLMYLFSFLDRVNIGTANIRP